MKIVAWIVLLAQLFVGHYLTSGNWEVVLGWLCGYSAAIAVFMLSGFGEHRYER